MSFPLTVAMRAEIDALQTDFDKAADMAGKAVEKIEQTFKDANPSFSTSALSSSFAQLAGGGAIALGIAGIVAIIGEANNQMAELADNARKVGMSTDDFQKVAYALQIGGLSAKDANDAIGAIAGKLNEAKTEGNDFTKILDANNQKWKDQHGAIIDVNSALAIAQTLIRNAADEFAKVKIGEKLGLSEEATRALDQMPGQFAAVSASARAAGVIINAEMIEKAKEFQQQWNETVTQWGAWFKATIIEISGGIGGLVDKAKEFDTWMSKQSIQVTGTKLAGVEIVPSDQKDSFDQFFEWLGKVQGAAPGAAAATNTVATAIEHVTSLLNVYASTNWSTSAAIYGGVDAASAQAAAFIKVQEAVLAASAGIGKTTKIPGDEEEDKKDTFDTTSDRLERRLKLYEAETASIGQNTRAKETAKATADLLAAAERAERDIDADLKGEINDLAARYGAAADAAAKAKQHFEQMNQAITYGGDEAIRILDGMRTHSLTAQQAITQLTNSIITMVEKAALLGQGPMAGLFGTAAPAGSGGIGGILGMIFGGARAGGGPVDSGRSYLVGESGPEILRMGGNGTVLPNRVISNIGGSSQANSFHVHLEAPQGSFDPAAAQAHAAVMRRAFEDMVDSRLLQNLRNGGALNQST